ncbi:MAG: type II secretion system protein J [Acidobacteriota bacterium]
MGLRSINKNSNSGFTLLEMMLALAILAIVFYSIMTVMNSYFGVLRSFTVERENMYEARMAMDQIVSNIVYERNNNGLSLAVYDSNTHIIGHDIYDTPYYLLSTFPGDLGSYDLIYYPGTRQLESGRVVGLVYAKNITQLTFNNLDGSNIQVVPQGDTPRNLNNSQFIEINLVANKDPVKETDAACSLTTYVYNK